MSCRLIHATANHPGAIALLQIHGDCREPVRRLTGLENLPLHLARVVDFDGIDHGVIVRLNENLTQLMPHGGPRVVQRLAMRLIELGADLQDPLAEDPLEMYPEATDSIDAMMLHALARAESPLAIDLLLDQPRRWREFIPN